MINNALCPKHTALRRAEISERRAEKNPKQLSQQCSTSVRGPLADNLKLNEFTKFNYQ